MVGASGPNEQAPSEPDRGHYSGVDGFTVDDGTSAFIAGIAGGFASFVVSPPGWCRHRLTAQIQATNPEITMAMKTLSAKACKSNSFSTLLPQTAMVKGKPVIRNGKRPLERTIPAMLATTKKVANAAYHLVKTTQKRCITALLLAVEAGQRALHKPVHVGSTGGDGGSVEAGVLEQGRCFRSLDQGPGGSPTRDRRQASPPCSGRLD